MRDFFPKFSMAEHFFFGPLNQISQGLDVFLLQGVPGANGKLGQIFDGTAEEVLQTLRNRNRPRRRDLGNSTLSEVEHVLEVLSNQVGGITNRRLGIHGTVGLHEESQTVEVRPLPDPGFLDREVGPTDRIVDGVDPDQVHGGTPGQLVLIGQDEPAALVHQQLDPELPVLFQA